MPRSIEKKIEINTEFGQALKLMEKTRQNLLLTGRAGTGKSTLLNYFRTHTRKKIVVLAPTGVAALNVGGVTVHSFFGFKPDITLGKVKKLKPGADYGKLYKKLDSIIVDEISMVRADLLDCVDKFMRLNGRSKDQPFGGVQLIMIGDLYQIPPVVSARDKAIFAGHYDGPFFFSSHIFSDPAFKTEYIELEKVYRQKDATFISLLNAVRNNSATPGDLERLNDRLDPDFEPPPDRFYVYLVTTNALAEAINEKELDKLKGDPWQHEAAVKGKFERSSLPAPADLILKPGSQVMLVNNDPGGRWVNGTVGQIAGFEAGEPGEYDAVLVELQDGETVAVYPNRWDMFEYTLDGDEIGSETVGSFIQYPIRVAFAITIHKSQGKTFDRVILDLTRSTFAHGQLYVALSRCTSFEGLVLKTPVQKSHIRMDWNVVRFLTRFQYDKAAAAMPLPVRIKFIKEAIKNKKQVKIVYLKGKDEKSTRVVLPKKIGEMEFNGHNFLGLKAHCLTRGQDRVFNVERILRIEAV